MPAMVALRKEFASLKNIELNLAAARRFLSLDTHRLADRPGSVGVCSVRQLVVWLCSVASSAPRLALDGVASVAPAGFPFALSPAVTPAATPE